MHTLRTTRRGGFTLVELLVVVALMLVLTALAAGVVYSGILDSHKLTSGTDKLNGLLLQQRAKAARTQSPQGVRLVVTGNFVTEVVPIEEPDPYVPNPAGDPFGYRIAFVYRQPYQNDGVTPTGPVVPEVHVIWGNPLNQAQQQGTGAGTANAALDAMRQEVSPADVLRLTEFGTLHKVTSATLVQTLQYSNGGPAYAIWSLRLTVLNQNLLPGIGSMITKEIQGQPTPPRTPNLTSALFGFRRQARPTLGEQPLQLTSGIGIDVANTRCPQNPDTGNFDILFGPGGEVQNAQSSGRIILWVRNPGYNGGANPRLNQDSRTDYDQAGEMALITVYTKTGAIATHPVNMPTNPGPNPGHDPYFYTTDGIASGL
jgi:prepilin-type N-terminal cleavage/methylation domain-containing protein